MQHQITSVSKDSGPPEIVNHGLTQTHQVIHDAVVQQQIEYVQPQSAEKVEWKSRIEQRPVETVEEYPEYYTVKSTREE